MGIRLSFAKRSTIETAAAVRGSATASGGKAANHLSPAYRWQDERSRSNSPLGSSFWSRISSFFRLGFMFFRQMKLLEHLALRRECQPLPSGASGFAPKSAARQSLQVLQESHVPY